MAEAVVTCLRYKLTDLLREELLQLPQYIQDHLRLLQEEFRRIQNFFEGPFSQWRSDDNKRAGAKEIADIAHDVEDLIHKLQNNSRYNPFVPLDYHNIDDMIIHKHQRLISICNEISIPRCSSDLHDHNNQEVNFDPISYPSMGDKSIIGFDDEREFILHQLLSPIARRSVISIVGVGGLGKTVLTESIYDSDKVKSFFPVRHWIGISQNCNVVEALKKLTAKMIPAGHWKVEAVTNGKDEDDQIQALTSLLQENPQEARYLIVLDDVWEKDVLEQILDALPNLNNGSRVILTTRLVDVAKSADLNITPIRLRFLDTEESRELVLRQVHPKEDGKKLLEEIKEEFQGCINICGGLPFALMLLGGLFLVKSGFMLKEFMGKLCKKNIVYEGKQSLTSLVVSYQDLPAPVKPCFLYLCSFPKYAHICASQIVKLWIAEGFVPKREGVTSKETAKSFLNELIKRCMVKVTVKRYDDTAKIVQVYNLLRDFCIAEAGSVGFLNIVTSLSDTATLVSSSSIRRLFLNYGTTSQRSSHTDHNWISRASNARTLLAFNFSGRADDFIEITSIINEAKLLQVVNVEGTTDTGRFLLPKEINGKIFLRHLSWTSWSKNLPWYLFPQSIQGLQDLQTLDVSRTACDCGSDGSLDAIGELLKLEMLRIVTAKRNVLIGLVGLTNLRKLKIYDTESEEDDYLLAALGSLQKLDSLELHSNKKIPREILTIFRNQHPLRSLRLEFSSVWWELPSGNEFPPNLQKLILVGLVLEGEPIEILGNLPKLKVLVLKGIQFKRSGSFSGEGSFPHLQFLKLDDICHWEEWEAEEGAMPKLTCFAIKECRHLKRIPQRLQKALDRGIKDDEGRIKIDPYLQFTSEVSPPTLRDLLEKRKFEVDKEMANKEVNKGLDMATAVNFMEIDKLILDKEEASLTRGLHLMTELWQVTDDLPDAMRHLRASVMSSFEAGLSFIRAIDKPQQPNHTGGKGVKRPQLEDPNPRAEMKRRQATRRKFTQQMVTAPLDDGHTWKKYGQKDILGSEHPRSYYRCADKYSHGCMARMQVQQVCNNPLPRYEVTYMGEHTCNVPWSSSPHISTSSNLQISPNSMNQPACEYPSESRNLSVSSSHIESPSSAGQLS